MTLQDDLRYAADPNTVTPLGKLWNLCEEAADRIDELEAALEIIRRKCVLGNGAEIVGESVLRTVHSILGIEAAA